MGVGCIPSHLDALGEVLFVVCLLFLMSQAAPRRAAFRIGHMVLVRIGGQRGSGLHAVDHGEVGDLMVAGLSGVTRLLQEAKRYELSEHDAAGMF